MLEDGPPAEEAEEEAASAGAAASSSEAVPKAKGKGKAKAKGAPKAKGKGKAKAKASPGGGGDGEPKEAGSPLDNQLRKIKELKVRWGQATQKGEAMVRAVTAGEKAWEWADNAQNRGEVQKKLKAIEEAIKHAGINELLIFEIAQLKKKYAGDEDGQLAGLCKKFGDLEPQLTDLEQTVATVWRRHMAQ